MYFFYCILILCKIIFQNTYTYTTFCPFFHYTAILLFQSLKLSTSVVSKASVLFFLRTDLNPERICCLFFSTFEWFRIFVYLIWESVVKLGLNSWGFFPLSFSSLTPHLSLSLPSLLYVGFTRQDGSRDGWKGKSRC